MPCEECRELNTHAFRSPDDLIHALRLASEEVDRGVLRKLVAETPTDAEREALASVLDSGAMPDAIRYRFACVVCGDEFTLAADTTHGTGGWVRQDKMPGP
jgi:hypothetical protein